MANESERLTNPDSTPGAVSTGYQAQNTRSYSSTTGIDSSYVTGGAGAATLEISGPTDVNGVLYNHKSAVIFTPPATGKYYIHLVGTGANLTPTLATDDGDFVEDDNGRYNSSGERILNWVIYFDGVTCYANRILTPENVKTQIEDLDEPEETFIDSNGTWTAKRSKYYKISLSGFFGVYTTAVKRIFIKSGDVWTFSIVTGTPNITTFTNGVSTVSINSTTGISGKDYSIFTSAGFYVIIQG